MQASDPRRFTNAAYTALVEGRSHSFFAQQLSLSIRQEARAGLAVKGVIIVHPLLQCGRGMHTALQARDPSGGFEAIDPKAQLCPYQPVQRGKRLFIDDRGDTYDQWVTALIRYRDCAEPAGLSAEQCGDAGTLISVKRRVVVVGLHDQMVTLAWIDPVSNGSKVPRIRCLPVSRSGQVKREVR